MTHTAHLQHRAAASGGPPTVLVDDARIGPRAGLVGMTTQQWGTVVPGTNRGGPFFAARAVCPRMAKAGLIGFTESPALQSGPCGMTANAIAPGFVSGRVICAAGGRWTEG
ncbi:hypothetical protein [Streptomyces sp. NPDC002172]